ncbi:MAG TPA: SDR family oxidoreductase [Gaiellaceae bacterium]|nr:SDR family oxidoreductase [Gaiellaceae bacterium]
MLITGASSGIGAACAERLARAGWKVFAGVRAEGAAPAGTTELLLDVTDADAIGRAAAQVGDRLDGLVDNAGIALASPLEHLPLDELRRQLEVNVVGQLAVTQALLPALRAARGRVVIVGSIAGTSALPFLGPYAISKFGLEALADALRLELAPDGIQVSLVRPGTIATPIWSKPQPIADKLSPEALERYGPRLAAMRATAAKRAAKAAPVDTVARAVEHALTASRPRTRYLVGRDARIRAAIERLPDRLRDRVVARALLRG